MHRYVLFPHRQVPATPKPPIADEVDLFRILRNALHSCILDDQIYSVETEASIEDYRDVAIHHYELALKAYKDSDNLEKKKIEDLGGLPESERECVICTGPMNPGELFSAILCDCAHPFHEGW